MAESDEYLVAAGQTLRRLRETLEKTQRDVEQHFGYSPSTLSKIESGKIRPSKDRLKDLAVYYGAAGEAASEEEALSALQAQIEESLERADAQLAGRNVPTRRFVPDIVTARQLQKAAATREEGLRRRVESLQSEAEDAAKALDDARTTAHESVVQPFFTLMSSLRGAALVSDPGSQQELVGEGDELPSLAEQLDAQRIAQLRRVVGTGLASGAAGAGLGAVGGAAVASAAYAAVTAFGTASTGAAIAGLSGAAAHSAAMAALGGGALSAGGLGVAGGAAVLSGIITVPVLLLAGAAVFYRGRKLRREQEGRLEAVRQAEESLDEIEPAVRRSTSWAREQTRLLYSIVNRATKHLLTVPAADPDTEPVEWTSLEARQQSSVRELAGLVAMISLLDALPIWPPPPSEEPLTPEAEEIRREWIDRTLRYTGDALRSNEPIVPDENLIVSTGTAA